MARMATLGAASSQTAARAFGTSAMRANTDGQKESIASFMAKFEAVKFSTMDNPNIPSDFMKPAREIPATPLREAHPELLHAARNRVRRSGGGPGAGAGDHR